MPNPVYKDLSLSDIDNEVRSLFTGTGDHGDQKLIVYQTGKTQQTISSWLGEESERPSPIATGLLLQCSIDRAFPKKGEKVWQIIQRFRREMLGFGREFPATDELPDQILYADFQEKWQGLMAQMQQMNLSRDQKQRFFLRSHGLIYADEHQAFGVISSEIGSFT
jgi:hypothetical protein